MRTSRCFVLAVSMLLPATAVDPAGAAVVVIQPSSQDAYVQQDSPNRLNGSGPQNKRVRVQSATLPAVWRGLVQFNLSTIPQFSTINAATLELNEGNNPGVLRTHGVHRINAAWLQSAVKWNNQPAHEAVATATAEVGTSRGFKSFTVTGDVQAFVDAPASNHGWMVKDAAEAVDNVLVTYVALEEDSVHEIGDRPRLTVDFEAPECTTNADCADVNPCTTNERCESGFCAVDATSCDDGDACTDDICDPEQGCLNPIGECNDGFDCTIDACDAVLGCTHTPVESVCTAGGCKVGTCVADPDDPLVDPQTGCIITLVEPDDTPCESDANQCTDDLCQGGQCTHTASTAGTPCAADGNPCTDDVCDGAGTCGVDNTEPCEDGDGCTEGDQCGGGSCVPGSPVVCTASDECHDVGTCDPGTGICSNPPKPGGEPCDDGDVCTHTDACDGFGGCVGNAEPEPGCRLPAVANKAYLLLKNKTPDKRDGFTWKWVKGTETLLEAFGSPLDTTGYTFCLYDASLDPQPRLRATVPPGGTCGDKPCWKTIKNGLRYKDKALDPDGVLITLLKAGEATKAKVILKGKGANLSMPPLPLTPKITVQLKNDLGECWEAGYTTPIKSTAELFKARAD